MYPSRWREERNINKTWKLLLNNNQRKFYLTTLGFTSHIKINSHISSLCTITTHDHTKGKSGATRIKTMEGLKRCDYYGRSLNTKTTRRSCTMSTLSPGKPSIFCSSCTSTTPPKRPQHPNATKQTQNRKRNLPKEFSTRTKGP